MNEFNNIFLFEEVISKFDSNATLREIVAFNCMSSGRIWRKNQQVTQIS